MKSVSRFIIIFLVSCIAFVALFVTYVSQTNERYSSKIKPNKNVNIKNDIELPLNFLANSLEKKFRDYTKSNIDVNTQSNILRTPITVAVVACGDRLDETLVMIKSAIVFTRSPLKFIVIADDPLIVNFNEKLTEWRSIMNNSFSFEVLPVKFPSTGNSQEWRKLFKPCASQRLFLPDILQDIDSVLYVDTDSLFLSPVEEVWDHFRHMNASQMAALTPEHEDPNIGWYNRFARHPYYGKLGVNSGVMLMNLTRMRAFHWTKYVEPVYKEYKLKITWGDQDIINIIFHFHPGKLYIYSCRFNFRSDHCMYMSVCKPAEQEGVAVLHGSRGIFHAEKQPAFRAVFRAFEEFQLGTDPYFNLYLPLRNYLEDSSNSNCGKIYHIFIKGMDNYFKKL